MRRKSKALVAALTLLVIIGVAHAIADTAPTPTIQAASEISYTSAKLKGKVNPNGGPSTTAWQFQYSSAGPEGPWAPGPEGHFEGAEAEENTPLPVEGELSGLKPNTTYYTRLVATNEGGQSSVSAPSFTTLEVATPSATIEAVSSPTSSTAQLVGHVNPNAPEAAPASAEVEAGFAVSWHFQCTPSCGAPSGPLVAADNTEHEVSAEATGLLPGTKYKVSLVAENAGASATAGPEEFTTEAAAPLIDSVGFSDVTTSGATLRAAIDPSGAPTTYRFEYTEDADFQVNGFTNATRAPAPDASAGSTPGPVAVSQAIVGLDPATKYDFRVIATNTVDSAESGAKAFTTFAATSEGPHGQFPGQGFLPDDRAWEMVSPPDKHGGNVTAVSTRTHAAADGGAVAFVSNIGFGDVRGGDTVVEYISRRDAQPGTNGWGTHAITPRLNSLNLEMAALISDFSQYQGDFSADLSHAIFRSARPLTSAPNSAELSNLYLRSDLGSPGAGSYELLSDSAAPPVPGLPLFVLGLPSSQPWLAGTSADFSHVIFESSFSLTEKTPVETEKTPKPPYEEFILLGPSQLYENTEGAVRLVGRVPHPARSLTVSATAGTFTLGLNGESTEAIPFDAPAGLIESALDALASVGGSGGDVTVTGGPGSGDGSAPYLLVFNGSLAASASLALSSDPSALSGGGASAEVAVDPRSYGCDDAGGSSIACVNAPSSQAGIQGGGVQGRNGHYSAHMVSADGSRILFQAPANFGGGNIYMREDGTRTLLLNASEKQPPEPAAGGAELWDASRDGSRVFFTTGESLVEGDENFSDLYMYEADKPAGERLTLLSVDHEPADDHSVSSVIGASDDGHYVYFIADGQLVAGEPTPVGQGLYLWHDGQISYIGQFGDINQARLNTPRTSWALATQTKTSRVTPDGHHLLFMAESDKGFKGIGGFSGYDHADHRELYTYDADSGQLRCASCNPSEAAATADALVDAHFSPGPIGPSPHQSHALSDEGRYIFFSTAERLAPEDTNGTSDAYLYDTTTREHRLLSSGEDKSPSFFMDASTDGSDAFIATAERLSRWDTDTSYDLYDARVGGGLPEPVPAPPSCQGDACQPTPTQLNDPTPASSSFRGTGNPSASRCPQGKRRAKARAGKGRCVKRKQHKRAAKHNRRAGR